MTLMVKLDPKRVAIEALPCFEVPKHKGHIVIHDNLSFLLLGNG